MRKDALSFFWISIEGQYDENVRKMYSIYWLKLVENPQAFVVVRFISKEPPFYVVCGE